MNAKFSLSALAGALVAGACLSAPAQAQTPLPIPRPAEPALVVASPSGTAGPVLKAVTTPAARQAVAAKRTPSARPVAAMPAQAPQTQVVQVAAAEDRSPEAAASHSCAAMACGRYVIMGVGF